MSLKHKENIVKLFGITNQFTEFDLDRVEKRI